MIPNDRYNIKALFLLSTSFCRAPSTIPDAIVIVVPRLTMLWDCDSIRLLDGLNRKPAWRCWLARRCPFFPRDGVVPERFCKRSSTRRTAYHRDTMHFSGREIVLLSVQECAHVFRLSTGLCYKRSRDYAYGHVRRLTAERLKRVI